MNSNQPKEKLCSVWSSKQEKVVQVRVFYSNEQQNDCQIISLDRFEPVV